MAWMRFSSYKKRIWDIQYQGSEIHIVFVIRKKSYWGPRVEVKWTTSKFKSVAFSFECPYKHYPKWDEVFAHLRRSLTYGLNQSTRQVTDIMLGVQKDKPHPIHRTVRISRAV